MGHWTRGSFSSPPEYEYDPGEERWLTVASDLLSLASDKARLIWLKTAGEASEEEVACYRQALVDLINLCDDTREAAEKALQDPYILGIDYESEHTR